VQLADLFKERLGEVDLNPIGKRVPFVTPPFLHIVDGKRRSLVIHGDDLFARQITLPVVEVEEIAKVQALLPSAFRAFGGIRHFQLTQHALLRWMEIECLAAGFTGLLHKKIQ
jgi:hypothetical protein